jgi:osmotically-inducible protein OsmY
MMSSRAASRIVIGVGLAVVFGIGVSIIMEQGTQNQAAHNAPAAAASSDQTAVNPPAADALASLRNAATAPLAPSAVASPGPSASNPPVAVNQAVLNGTNSASSGSDANESSASSNDTNMPKPGHGSRHAPSTASVKKSSAPPNDSNLKNAHGDSGSGVTTLSSPPAANDAVVSSETTSAPSAEAKPASENSSGSSASGADVDGQITAQVRSSIATLAPGSNIDVKAISGIVALAGSVPSQDVVEQARQAAQQVPGVKQVDTSALMVRNQ